MNEQGSKMVVIVISAKKKNIRCDPIGKAHIKTKWSDVVASRSPDRKKEEYTNNLIQWCYSPTGLWPTERPPPVSEASANFLRIEGCHVVSATDPHGR